MTFHKGDRVSWGPVDKPRSGTVRRVRSDGIVEIDSDTRVTWWLSPSDERADLRPEVAREKLRAVEGSGVS